MTAVVSPERCWKPVLSVATTTTTLMTVCDAFSSTDGQTGRETHGRATGSTDVSYASVMKERLKARDARERR